ncbi:MAG: hypothetical protein QOJ09_1191 [Actinomycetota bacterium]|nr:hypothetical protein [Actinomycetota bacterium]
MQAEVRRQGAEEPDDDTTDREAMETALMDAGESDEGEQIGDEEG